MSFSPALTNSTNFSNFVNNTSYGARLPKTVKPISLGVKLGSFASTSVVPTLGSYAIPATIAASLMQPAIDKIKSMYDDKFKELGLGQYATPVKIPVSNKEKPYSPPEAIISHSVTPDVEDTLLSVLKTSSSNIESVSRSILYSNELFIKSFSDLQKTISLNSDIDVAYREIELNNSLLSNEYLMTIANSLKSSYLYRLGNEEIVQAYRDETLSSTVDIVTALQEIKTNFTSGIKISSDGLKIQKSDSENDLISKKLQHINYDTTPVQLDNLGNTIPEATPQQMRAIKNAVVAKKNSDENTFEIDDDDMFDMFQMPDISSMFERNDKTVRNAEVNATF